MNELVWCALGLEYMECGTCPCGNPCAFMNARSQNLRTPKGCNMFFECNRCCIVSKVPSAIRAASLGGYYPPEMQMYLCSVAKWYKVTKLPGISQQHRSLV